MSAATAADPFSHRHHAPLKLKCDYCHTTAGKTEQAGFPGAEKCRTCHAEMKLDRAFPTARVYKLPDYVSFSHARHRAAKVECAACHGPVMERDVLTKEAPTRMKACVDCHKAKEAGVSCNFCHELNQ